MADKEKINPTTGKPYPDISENVWSRFDDDGYGIKLVEDPEKNKGKKKHKTKTQE